MCNCKYEVSEKIKEKLKLDNGMVDFELLSGRTSTNFIYTNEKGKEKIQMILNSHCPFCGKSYLESEE